MTRRAPRARFGAWRRVGLGWGTFLWAGLLLALAFYQRTPGYMDEAYYWVVGRTWAAGQGLREPFLWNYLDDPAGVPHPAGAYWQPLPALLAGLAAIWPRLPFVLLAALLPWLTRRLADAWDASPQAGHWAALWAAWPGFYLAYLPAVDGFAPLFVLGAVYWAWLPRLWQEPTPARRWAGLGVLVALVHLTRAEGPLWLLGTLALAWAAPARDRRGSRLAWVLLGYAAVMAPWWWRNSLVWGAPWPPGASRALWFTHYNDLFYYPPADLTPARWWAQGWAAIVRDRLWALRLNAQTALAVHGLVVLGPLMLWGAWRQRRRPVTRAALALYGALAVLMTVVFPFAGARGGFFHSVAGLQPLLWVWAGQGFEAALAWAAARRGWNLPTARRVLGLGLTVLLAGLTLTVTAARLRAWPEPAARYRALWAAWQQAASPAAVDGPVLVANPPLWAWVTGRPALVTPSGGPEAVTAVARRYAARGLIVEGDAHPDNLAAWWAEPGPRAGWRYLGPSPTGEAQLYEFTAGSR